MFELDACDGNGRVCLVFPPKPEPPPVDHDQMGKRLSLAQLEGRGFEYHLVLDVNDVKVMTRSIPAHNPG
jgi:hypothetical protein